MSGWRDGLATMASPRLYGGSEHIVGEGLTGIKRAGIAEGTIVLMVVYLFGMAALAIRGYLLKQKAKADGGVEGYMNFHFLAGSKFGAIVLFCNWAAQYVGGIVVIKTPNDSRWLGYFMLMWISGCSWCGATFNVIQCRTREIMKGRNYLSPNDYLTDRYKNSLITGFGILSNTFQMIMFIGLEVLALVNVVQGLLGMNYINENEGIDKVIAWLLFMFIYACELLGGMASVALTDAIQASLLLFSFFFLPFLVLGEYGGFEGVGQKDCQNLHIANNFGPVRVFGSAFDIWSTDACYTNVHAVDTAVSAGVAGSCALAFDPTNYPGADFSMSFITFLGGAMGVIPPWQQRNFTFGSKGQFGHRVCDAPDGNAEELAKCERLATVCNSPVPKPWDWNASGSETADWAGASAQCPPDGWMYVAEPTTFTENSTAKDLTFSELFFNCTEFGTNAEECAFTGVSKTLSGITDDTETHVTYAGHIVDSDGNKHLVPPAWYPMYDAAQINVFGAGPMTSTQFGCVEINMYSHWFFKYQPREIAAYMFSFGFMWIAFAMTPITLHRTMTAKSSDEVRKALAVLHLFPICFFLPVILLGITASGLWQETTFTSDHGVGNDAFSGTVSAFALLCFKISEATGFGAFIGILAMVSCIASFMSTADSIVLCGSMLFTVDFYYHLCTKNTASVGSLVIVSKVVSCAMIVTGVCIGLYSKIDFVEMLNIGNGVAGALIPVYMGMFIHALQPAEVFVGQLVNLIVVTTMECLRFYPANEWGATTVANGDCLAYATGELANYDASAGVNATVGSPGGFCPPATWDTAVRGQWHGCPSCFSAMLSRESRGEVGYPHLGVSRYSPQLPAPLGDGNDDETYLWLLPPFWGVIATVTSTLISHFIFKFCLKGVNPWFERVSGLPDDVVKNFGAERMDLDREGKIVAKLMQGVKEPVKTPMAWPFLLFPFVVPWFFLPFYDDEFINVKGVAGMPDWATTFTIINSLGTGCLMIVCIWFWKGREGEGDEAGKDFAVFGGTNKVAPSTKVQM